ncbi:MAG: hypothetical protein P4L50_25550 [Anaerolineaceae bacterium]|nr:hypothetical protein [Anaerolineaceae bacterium]
MNSIILPEDVPDLSSLLTEKQMKELAARIYALELQGNSGFGEVRIVIEHGHPRFIKLEICDSFDRD